MSQKTLAPHPPAELPFRYQIFGLVLQSTFALPMLPSAQAGAPADVVLRTGKLENAPFEARAEGLLWKAAPEVFELDVPGLLKLRVQNGCDVRVDARPDADPELITTVLLGPALAALAHQRRLLPLHAAAVQTRTGAALLAGVSGSGKSVLVQALIAKGYRMIADDLSVLAAAPDQLHVLPAWNAVRLMPDAAAAFGHDWPQQVSAPASPKSAFLAKPAPPQPTVLKQIIFLGWTPDAEIVLEPLARPEAMARVSAQVYQSGVAKGCGHADARFSALLQIARDCPCFIFMRPHDMKTLDTVADRLSLHLGACP